ncbi:MAG: hypothetical protein LUD47_03185 [Clostridia bacterium]|nr:hypothetical protein [Clostridia bacterium]
MMYDVPEGFLARMKESLGEEYESFVSVYDRPPYRALRANTLKITGERLREICPFTLGDGVAAPEGGLDAFYYDFDGIGKRVEYSQGLLYPQEPSAMFAAGYLGVKPGDRVLDLCAAPGGKSTQIAEALRGGGVLYSNEINAARARVLLSNIERHGVKNCVVTCVSPHLMAERFVSYFDKVLVDAPCSGEGMFRKEPEAIANWNKKNVEACARRQKDILESAYGMLRGGGTLVYSTCTFSEDEDEGVVEWLLKTHSDSTLSEMRKFLPHEIRGEGHFVAKIVKEGMETREPAARRKGPGKTDRDAEAFRKFASECGIGPCFTVERHGGSLYGVPSAEGGYTESGLFTLCAGVKLGEAEGGVFRPSHALAMCLKEGEAECVEVDRETAVRYLSGETFPCGFSGWRIVTHNGFSLGWCKGTGGVAKNHLPKGLRVTQAR